MNALVITRTSFCCTKKLKKLHLFLTKVAKSCIYSQTLKRTVIYSSDLFTHTVIPRYIALHLSRLRCYAEFFTMLFCAVDSDWLRGVTVVLNFGKEVDLQNHIKPISSNFVGFNIFIKSKTYRMFSA